MAERCDFTDLPTDSCSHCLKQVGPEQEERRELAALLLRPGWVASSFRGQCSHCGEWYGAGTPVHIDRAGQAWVGGCCADAVTADRVGP